MPQISVIVPVYNVEKYIHRCVDSILAQTFTDFELILVDDGSPDNCGIICDEYAEKDSRIHVIHKENGGLSSARNAGIDWAFENSNSEWITFIDSDDWIHTKYLEALYNAVKETELNLSVCGFERTEGENIDVDEESLCPIIVNSEEFYCEKNVNAVVAWGKLYRKEDFRIIRYPKGKLHEDEFTTYKILFKYDEIAFIDSPLYFYYVNQSSIMKSNWSPKRLAAYDAILGQIDYFSSNKFEKAEIYCFTNFACYLKVLENKKEILENYSAISKQYRKELKKRLKKYKPGIKKCAYPYEYLYPRFSKFFWLGNALLNKLRRNN